MSPQHPDTRVLSRASIRAARLRSLMLCALILGACSERVSALDASGTQRPASCLPLAGPATDASTAEPGGVGAGIVFDEHLLTDGTKDEDYDGGGEVTFSGKRGGPIGRALDRALGFVDDKLCPPGRFSARDWESAYAFATGLVIFTPRDLSARGVLAGDRPYASLFFLSAGRRYVSSEAAVAYDSSLTVGMLGLAAAETVQSTLHHLTGSVQPQGWSHQISAGGEPTARYSAARQALLAEFGATPWHGDLKWTVAGSAGTVTEGSLALSMRWGRIESPWWSFTPEQNMYVQETQPLLPALARGAPLEVFAFAGARAKARPYDAFLEGQFRASDLTYHWGELNHLLGEAWGGIEMRTPSGWTLQYLARWESPELRTGTGARSFVWGSIQVARSLQ